MAPPSLHYLSDVSYREEKKEVLVAFSNAESRTVARFPFFPRVFANPKRVPPELLKETIASFDSKRFSMARTPRGSIQVMARTFSDLKSLMPLWRDAMDWQPLLLEPERQFLVLNDWSYGDAFQPEQNAWKKPPNPTTVPSARFSWSAEPFDQTVRFLQLSSPAAMQSLLESASFSNLLKVPLPFVPDPSFQRAELWLENLFFENQCDAPNPSPQNPARSMAPPQGVFSQVAEIDLTPALLNQWMEQNVGWDSLNCGCCAPAHFGQQNVSPASKVRVEFLSDGLYFESAQSWFSREFDEQHPETRSVRLDRQREWFLKTTPIGPFHSGSQCLIPLRDAQSLALQEKARLLESGHELAWFCSKQPSFFVRSARSLQRELERWSVVEQQRFNRLVSTNGIHSMQAVQQDLLSSYGKSFGNSIQSLLRQLVWQPSNPKSRFFERSLARSIESLWSQSMQSFEREASALGGRLLHSFSSKAFVESDNALHLVQQFSKHHSIAEPSVQQHFSRFSFYR